MNSDLYPSVRLDPSYSTQLKRTRDADPRRYLQKHLQDARWLIRSLDQRHQTILRIAAEIIRRQQRFMTHGELKPLTRRDIADSLELHPSTVSRAAAGKYMLTPNGTREFRSFFARQIDVDSGPGYSASMVQLNMRKMIDSEPPEKPLSDLAISQPRQGIQVAGGRPPVPSQNTANTWTFRPSHDGEERSDATYRGHSP